MADPPWHGPDSELLADTLRMEHALAQRQESMNLLLGRRLPPSYARDAVVRAAIVAHSRPVLTGGAPTGGAAQPAFCFIYKIGFRWLRRGVPRVN